jgi:hypothetical protein
MSHMSPLRPAGDVPHVPDPRPASICADAGWRRPRRPRPASRQPPAPDLESRPAAARAVPMQARLVTAGLGMAPARHASPRGSGRRRACLGPGDGSAADRARRCPFPCRASAHPRGHRGQYEVSDGVPLPPHQAAGHEGRGREAGLRPRVRPRPSGHRGRSRSRRRRRLSESSVRAAVRGQRHRERMDSDSLILTCNVWRQTAENGARRSYPRHAVIVAAASGSGTIKPSDRTNGAERPLYSLVSLSMPCHSQSAWL